MLPVILQAKIKSELIIFTIILITKASLDLELLQAVCLVP